MSTIRTSRLIAVAAALAAVATPLTASLGGPPPPGTRALPQEIATAAEFSFGHETGALAFDVSGWWGNVSADQASLYAPLDFDVPETGSFENMFAHLYDNDPDGSITIILWRKSWDGSAPAEIVAMVESSGASTDDQTPVTTSFLGQISMNYFYYLEAVFSADPGERRLYYAGVSYDPTVVSAPTEPGASLGSPLSRPNPFQGETSIVFDLPVPGDVRLDILNVAGRRVRTMRMDELPAGSHAVSWDGRSDSGHLAPNGSYFYRLETSGFTATKKMVLLR